MGSARLWEIVAVTLACGALTHCGARTALRDPTDDAAAPDAAPLPVVECPPGSGASCAPGETCCASPACPVRYACAAATICPALDFNGTPSLGCDERSDCSGEQCCAAPYTYVSAAGRCTAWASGCRSACSAAPGVTGIPSGRLCRIDTDCTDLGQRCCTCGRSPVGVCAADCAAPACANAP